MAHPSLTIEGVNTESLLEKIRSYGHRSAHYAASMDEGVAAIAAAARRRRSGRSPLAPAMSRKPRTRFSTNCGRPADAAPDRADQAYLPASDGAVSRSG